MDWSGFIRGEFQYQEWDSMYGEYNLVLQPEVQVLDRLSVRSSLELFLPFHDESLPRTPFLNRRAGVIFFKRPYLNNDSEDFSVLFHMSQLYINYESEFFSLRMGKAPYHFGLGLVYNEGRDPFDYWFSAFNQVSLRFEHEGLYVQPAVIHDQDESVALLQAGLSGSKWSLEGLYAYTQSHQDFAEFYGEYFKKNWDIKTSVSYIFEDQLSMGVATELGLNLKTAIPSRVLVKTGVAQRFSFHPNYEVAFLLWNQFISTEEDEVASEEVNLQEVNLQSGRISNLFYFNPSWNFNLLEGRLNLIPSFTFGSFLFHEEKNYELDINAKYFISKNFSISFLGGIIHRDKKVDYGLLGQAAVTF